MSFNSSAVLACSPSAIPVPLVFGTEVLSLEANQVTNYTRNIGTGLYMNHGGVDVQGANFCNISVAYTHPGQNDTVNVQMFLPSDGWNGRMQAIGGNGWQAGLNFGTLAGMTAAMGEGYASLSTDAGLGTTDSPTWGLISPGNPDRYLLQNLASTSLNDLSLIGKDLVNSYYGTPPVYSYFSGCSQGGRQGMMLAQRYPEAFDGIAASAPAINWSQLFVGDLWANVIMNTEGIFPRACEMQAINDAVIAHCDANDGLVDGIISDPDSCEFDPATLVGTPFNCTDTGDDMTISAGAAYLTQQLWDGPRTSNDTSLWTGFAKGTVLSSTDTTSGGTVALTTCNDDGECTAPPLELLTGWVVKFVTKNDATDIAKLSRKDFETFFRASINEYGTVMDTNDPDLSAFRARGGKIVGYHGLADGIIAPGSTAHYYDAVTALDADVRDFYRMFMAPGLGHCFGGHGVFPAGTFDAMRGWVENGTAPETLEASTVGASPALNHTLCPYPLKALYEGAGNATGERGFTCK